MSKAKSGTSVRARREQQQAEQQRRRRLYYGGTALAVVLIIGLFVLLRQLNAPKLEDVVLPDPLAAPANAEGKAWGPADTAVLIEEYSDFQCSFCREFATGPGRQLADAYAGSGQVRFEYHNFAFLGRESTRAAEAAHCASEQGQFWQYHDTLFANQRATNSGAFSNTMLKFFAEAIGLDEAAFNACFDSGRYEELVQTEKAEAEARGITSTPTLFLNGEQLPGGLTFEQYQGLIEAQLLQ